MPKVRCLFGWFCVFHKIIQKLKPIQIVSFAVTQNHTSQAPSPLAFRYARALIAYADEKKALPAVVEQAGQVAFVIRNSEPLRQFLVSPLIARDKAAEVLGAVFASTHEILRRFLTLLAENRRLEILAESLEALVLLAEARENTVRATATAAAELSAAQKTSIQASLEKATGKKIKLETKVDEKLLGGVTVDLGGVRLDHSVSGRLARLSARLREAA